MSVDWFTVGAQIVNFLILVWLLKKFLYKPVLTAMHQRRQKVEDELAAAASMVRAAENEKEQYLALQEEVREQAEASLRAARREAEALREKLFQEVETAAAAARQRSQDELDREKALFIKAAGVQLGKQFQRLARSAFRDLADVDLEERMVFHFCAALADPGTGAEFFGKLPNPASLEVCTAFPLGESAQAALRAGLGARLQSPPSITFRDDPELIAGMLLASAEQKLEWHLARYLDDFQTEMESFFN
ncbi:MAG: hypothetical protein JXR80_11585 [Deltaproteobacteria bacterium]|nr:hypothetical protein [Deltaproteobacteria bacterium]